MVLLFNLIHCVSILFAKGFMFVRLYTHGSWLDVAMVRSLGWLGMNDGVVVLVIDYAFLTIIHGLIVSLDLVFVAESRVDFLFDNGSHAIS